MLRHWVSTARRAVGRFIRSRDGNVAMMFATLSVPLLVATGGLVDYSRAWMAQTKLQDASDATATMLSKSASTLTATQMGTQASSFFLANYEDSDALPVTVTPSYSASGPSVTVTASTAIKSYFLGLIGIQQMPISVSSTVVWGQARLRVALVLDNTGSMADDGKITALKTATHSLLTQLQNAGTNAGDVYVSIIPFSKDLNVGSSNYAASWIDWTDWNAANGTCSKSGYSSQSTCTAQGSCSKSTYTSQSTCQSHSGTWTLATWTPKNHNTWNGCVTDRGTDTGPGTATGYDQKVDAPISGNTSTLFPADQYSSCSLTAVGLTADWTSLNSLVDQMQPNGTTNQPIGLVWGWQSLVGGGPFTAPALDPAYQYTQVVVLLSDGLNTQDRWYGNGSSTSTQVDARMYNGSGSSAAGTCQNVKAAGISVYSIQVDTGGDPTSTLLQNCASVSSQFYKLTSANQIVSVFNTIGTALSQLRISK